VLYLHAEDEVLLRRYAETRRRHPLAGAGVSLADAIAEERRLLHPLIDSADLVIDTSRMSVHELRDLIAKRVEPQAPGPALDPVRVLRLQARHARRRGFRLRCAHPAESLLGAGAEVADGAGSGRDRVPRGEPARRAHGRRPRPLHRVAAARLRRDQPGYLTIAIGCTGGQHRSVYLVERLARHFRQRYPQLLVRHNALPQ
jgi:UPF0042 nucleotide-binding protein